jgi:hypothetical protein
MKFTTVFLRAAGKKSWQSLVKLARAEDIGERRHLRISNYCNMAELTTFATRWRTLRLKWQRCLSVVVSHVIQSITYPPVDVVVNTRPFQNL